MTVSIRGPVAALKAFLEASNLFRLVEVGDPADVPQSPTASILLSRYSIPETTLESIVEERAVTIRIYVAVGENSEERELELDDMVSSLYTSFFDSFTLGGLVREIEPTKVTTTFAYQLISGSVYRVVDIFLPMIIDDSASFDE